MKKIMILLLLFPYIGNAYTKLEISCRINNGFETQISCGEDWVKMSNYPNISVRLQSCMKSRRLQVVEIKIKNVIYKPNAPDDFEVDSIIEHYHIECTEY